MTAATEPPPIPLVRFNRHPLRFKRLNFNPVLGPSDWPEQDWKYADYTKIWDKLPPVVNRIIAEMPLSRTRKRILVDVKTQDLVPELCSCVPGWHFDGVLEPGPNKLGDLHHLITLFGPKTEFLKGELTLMLDPKRPNMDLLRECINDDARVVTAPDYCITTFDSFQLHRGVHATAPCRRLLIRVTETDTVLSNNRPTKPSRGARV